jgi:hypothetical protein
MPTPQSALTEPASLVYQSISFEIVLSGWLMNAGWEVFSPMIDHGSKTDIVISDGPNFYRIQVKSVDPDHENRVYDSQWENSRVDYVIFASRCGNWGYIAPAYLGSRKINHPEHIRFHQNVRNFAKAFEQVA